MLSALTAHSLYIPQELSKDGEEEMTRLFFFSRYSKPSHCFDIEIVFQEEETREKRQPLR